MFHIGSGKTITVSISGLTITNGYAGGGFPDDIGGGIYNDHAALTVNDCAIEGNYALVEGGGIYNDATGSGRATLQISNSKIKANGGGILNDAIGDGQATVQITSSSITNNIGTGMLKSSLPLCMRPSHNFNRKQRDSAVTPTESFPSSDSG